MTNEIEKNNSEIIIYQSEDGKIRLDVRLEEKTVWLTQEQIAQLYGKGRSTITEHISNIFKEGELEREKVCRKFRHTTQHGAVEGKTQSQEVTLYNLDVIISVGYRVKSIVGTRFRQWATERLAEYIIKGFTMDDERLKNLGGGYRKFQVKTLSPVEQDYLESIKLIEKKTKKKGNKGGM